jgi:hypothetical protein
MKILPLKSVAEIMVGYQSRTRIEHDPSGTHKIVQGRDFLSRDHLCMDALLTFNPARTPGPTIEPEDVLFQARGGEHFAYCVFDPPPGTLASSSFYIIRPKRNVLMPYYLAWWINQSAAQRYLQAESQHTSMPFVSKAVLSHLDVRIPDLRIQETIHHVTNLMQKELVLRKQIAEQRRQLVTATCLAGIQNKEPEL